MQLIYLCLRVIVSNHKNPYEHWQSIIEFTSLFFKMLSIGFYLLPFKSMDIDAAEVEGDGIL